MGEASAARSIDVATRQRLQEMLVLIVRMGRMLDGPFERAGLTDLSGNNSVLVLTQLHRRGPLRPRDLQGDTGLTSGGFTKLIDRLVSLGAVERFARGEKGDGRSVLVRLTPAGLAAARRIAGVFAEARDDCRPLAKELVQLAEAAGARTVTGAPDLGDTVELSTRAGAVLTAAIATGDETLVVDAVNSLIALAYVDLHPPARPGALVDAVGLTSGGVSKLLDRLVAQGLLERRRGMLDTDHRAVVLQLTDAGARLLREQMARVLPHVDDMWLMGHVLAEGSGSLT